MRLSTLNTVLNKVVSTLWFSAQFLVLSEALNLDTCFLSQWGPIVQWNESSACIRGVAGSNPARSTKPRNFTRFFVLARDLLPLIVHREVM
jgi:hypothetical protein